MKLRRVIGISVTTYLATILTGLLLARILGLSFSPPDPPSSQLILLSMILAILWTWFGAWWYFRTPYTPAGAKPGLFFGLIAAIVAFVFDGMIVGLSLAGGTDVSALFRSAYQYWFFGIMLLAGLAGTAFVGKIMANARERRLDGSL